MLYEDVQLGKRYRIAQGTGPGHLAALGTVIRLLGNGTVRLGTLRSLRANRRIVNWSGTVDVSAGDLYDDARNQQ